jgi:hypothetical protein
VKYVMNPLVAMFDGLSITFFGKSKKAYMTLDAAVEWAVKEHKEAPSEFNRKRAEALIKGRDRILSGGVVD